MNQLRHLKRQMFDIRPGEHLRTWSMFFYLLFVLFAYYIVKPVSRAMFLTRFNIDKLPYLYILIAVFGGILAYLYSKLAAKTSLRLAVFAAMAISVACLLVMWWLIRMRLPWMIYVLNIWVSLFSVVSVSQGWLVASNLFDNREAKRLYPLLGMGMVVGAAFGGEFTSRTALLVGTNNLLIASALMCVLAYISFRMAAWKSGGAVTRARAGDKQETDFSFREMLGDIARSRHLQIIVGMMVVMYLVDTLVEYQFQAMARTSYTGDHLTAFFGQFYGIYLNGIEFVFQLFITSLVVNWFGVGGTLHISPIAVAGASIATMAAPGVTSASAVRLTEASTRYTLNKTSMELLYMPLPLELRNRIKAFIDICVDRLSRGIGGVLLIVLTGKFFHLGVRGLAVVVFFLCLAWLLFSHVARKEYVATIRKRLEARRLDLESVRVSVRDATTVRLLEAAAAGSSPRQAAYALSLLGGVADYDPRPLVARLLTSSPPREVREKIYEICAARGLSEALESAMAEIRTAQAGNLEPVAPSAVPYALAVAPDRARLAADLLEDAHPALVEGALEALRTDRELASRLLTPEWIVRNAASESPRRRALAAGAVAVTGGEGSDILLRLLHDADAETAAAAIRAAGRLRERAYFAPLVEALAPARLRADAIDALAACGPSICGALSDVLLDESVPLRIRRQVPRVLKGIPSQRSVDVLLGAINHPDLSIRTAVLKALNRLRESGPGLNFEDRFVTEQMLAEARYYCELSAALAPFRERDLHDRTASRLLARTIEEHLKDTLERLFRLLGLRYPPREIYSAWRAVCRAGHEEHTAAVELLDNLLDRNIRRFLLPLLDAPEHALECGRELFGLQTLTVENAIRELIRSRDSWLVACAMAAAAELKLRDLVPEIAHAAAQAESEVSEVARSAEAALVP